MRCPQCGTQLAPKTAICPACDYVVDNSAFQSELPIEHLEQDTPAEGTPWAEDEITEPPRRAAPEDTDVGDDGEEEAAAGRTRRAVLAPAPRPAPKASAREEIGIGYGAAEELAQEARFFLQELSGSDKAAFWGSALVAISCFFPWRQTALEGDTLGFMGLGAGVLLLSIALCGSIWARERDWVARAKRANTWYLQFACAVLIPLWTLVCIKLAWNPVLVRATVGTSDVWASKPGLGAIIAVPCSVLALLGTLVGLKGRA
ncbi:MAG: hypothetical protein K1X64_05520 [Myxococcaceae bacterium]|nr:hypothetical protein [Myxococcaceae bacterium]